MVLNFVLDKYPIWGILDMRIYSISSVAKLLGVDRKTLRRWVRKKKVAAPTPEIVGGRLSKCWTEADVARIRKYKIAEYWGKGINRKTGTRAKRVAK